VRYPLLKRGLSKWLKANPPLAPKHYWPAGDQREMEELAHQFPSIRSEELSNLRENLVKHPLLKNIDGVHAAFSRAGIETLEKAFNFQGPMLTVITNLVDFLLSQGRFEDGSHPLGLLLYDLQSYLANKHLFDPLISRYDLLPGEKL
jgi:hypothetical protein